MHPPVLSSDTSWSQTWWSSPGGCLRTRLLQVSGGVLINDAGRWKDSRHVEGGEQGGPEAAAEMMSSVPCGVPQQDLKDEGRWMERWMFGYRLVLYWRRIWCRAQSLRAEPAEGFQLYNLALVNERVTARLFHEVPLWFLNCPFRVLDQRGFMCELGAKIKPDPDDGALVVVVSSSTCAALPHRCTELPFYWLQWHQSIGFHRFFSL